MSSVLKYANQLLLLVLFTLTAGCSSENTTNESQAVTIVNYLEGSHDPLLIPSTEVSGSLDINPPFYFRYGDYAFRYIATYYNAGRESSPEIEKGSQIEITFSLFPFVGRAIGSNNIPNYTNDPYYENYYKEAGLNTQYWDFTPLSICVGSGNIFKGLDEALIGCREGDVIEVYTTYLMGYGDEVIGTIDKESSMVAFVKILSVN